MKVNGKKRNFTLKKQISIYIYIYVCTYVQNICTYIYIYINRIETKETKRNEFCLSSRLVSSRACPARLSFFFSFFLFFFFLPFSGRKRARNGARVFKRAYETNVENHARTSNVTANQLSITRKHWEQRTSTRKNG